jgi:hypothetical protein
MIVGTPGRGVLFFFKDGQKEGSNPLFCYLMTHSLLEAHSAPFHAFALSVLDRARLSLMTFFVYRACACLLAEALVILRGTRGSPKIGRIRPKSNRGSALEGRGHVYHLSFRLPLACFEIPCSPVPASSRKHRVLGQNKHSFDLVYVRQYFYFNQKRTCSPERFVRYGKPRSKTPLLD